MATYSGSSSDTETEPEGPGGRPPRSPIDRLKKRDSAGLPESFKPPKPFRPFLHSFPALYAPNPHSGAERGDPDQKQRGEVLVHHGLLPARDVFSCGEGQPADLPVQPVAQGALAGRESGRPTQCECLGRRFTGLQPDIDMRRSFYSTPAAHVGVLTDSHRLF